MMDGTPATWRDTLFFWGMMLVGSLPAIAVVSWWAGAWS